MFEGRLSVVIPAWNEERRIGPALARSIEVLHRLAPDHEIVVVDDGSTDGTLAAARAAAAAARSFRGLANERNLGKGGAVRRGMLEAAGDYILFCDADESTPMAMLEHFLPGLAAGRPVLIGTRKNRQAIIARHQPWLRETMGKGFTLLAQALAGVRVTDFTCGFKIFRRDAAREIFARQTLHNWSFDAEILFLARHLGYAISEVPVTWTNDEDTRVRLLRDTAGSLRGLLHIVARRARGAYGPARR
ncbi:MAG: glycosyltransferase family 2 protein [bacterium]|jgi:glycosyltransferase involved in cell wall biosynthesis|nr:glycosyltransferase family 2 protein [bacterium]